MKSLIIPFLALAILFTGCDEIQPCGFSKDGFLTNYSNFLTKVKDANEEYDDATWEKQDEKFKKFTSDCYQNYEADMSLDEKQEFWIGAMGYLGHRYGTDLAREFYNSDNELVQIVKENGVGIIEDVWDVFRKEFFDNPKLKNAWEKFKNEIKDAFQNIEEEFEN